MSLFSLLQFALMILVPVIVLVREYGSADRKFEGDKLEYRS